MSTLSQVFPCPPTFTEHNLPDLSGKVFIVTGSAVGVGYELAKILYEKNGTVYIATRSEEKISRAIASIRQEHPNSRGRLVPLIVDLADLTTIRPAARTFLEQESRLDVLVHNAGVMRPPAGSKSKQGHDLEMATNCLGPFLLNHHLQHILLQTAHQAAHPGSVRIVWVSSLLGVGTIKGGMSFDPETGSPKIPSDPMSNYMQSKVGNVFLAHECAKRLGGEGILSMSVHPGLMKTELQRHMNPMVGKIMHLILKPAKYGAYSELYAGFSPDVTLEHNGGLIIPWGRHGTIPEDIARGLKSTGEGGMGLSQRFWDWCVRETRRYQ
ncbi:hypothetical protein VTN96DRAFT_3262 [Rasamsonia emersonii]